MNPFKLFVCFFLLSGTCFARQLLGQTSTGRQILLGKISEADLRSNEFAEWYLENFNNYNVKSELVLPLDSMLHEVRIQIFMGTWCGDSRRQVPPFLKILHAVGFDFTNLSMVAVDYEGNDMKQSPGHEESGLGIYRVPTFIFSKDGNEIGRIVESPVVSLEKDIRAVLQDNYQHNYTFYYSLLKKISGLTYDNLLKIKNQLLLEFSENFRDNRKLLTLARVLFDAQRIAEARYLMEMQLEINPQEESSLEFYDRILISLGEKNKS